VSRLRGLLCAIQHKIRSSKGRICAVAWEQMCAVKMSILCLRTVQCHRHVKIMQDFQLQMQQLAFSGLKTGSAVLQINLNCDTVVKNSAHTLLLFYYYFFAPSHKAAGFKHCTEQGMTATASNRSQKCWGKRQHYPLLVINLLLLLLYYYYYLVEKQSETPCIQDTRQSGAVRQLPVWRQWKPEARDLSDSRLHIAVSLLNEAQTLGSTQFLTKFDRSFIVRHSEKHTRTRNSENIGGTCPELQC